MHEHDKTLEEALRRWRVENAGIDRSCARDGTRAGAASPRLAREAR
jgi:hypothetical protein